MKKILKNNKIMIWLIIGLLFIVFLFVFNNLLYINLNGNKNMKMQVHTKYVEKGYKAKFWGRNISNEVKISNNLNSSKIGTYKITYKVKKMFFTKKVIRKIEVVDIEKPKIKLLGKNTIDVCPSSEYKEEGYEAIDNYDGDLTNKVKIENKGNYILYKVTDSSKNKKTVKRIINRRDIEKPTISLNGGDIKIIKGQEYKEKSVTISDNCDTDLINKLETIGSVDTNKVGTYKITYKVKDSSNNESSVIRKVIVSEQLTNSKNSFYENIVFGPTYVKGILIVNKKYSLPSTYNYGNNNDALGALGKLQQDAKNSGYNIGTLSGFRSYDTQYNLYNKYVKMYGKNEADKISARPGHSEHQTGLAFDVGSIDNNYGNTAPGAWLKNNAHKYGFIIRYPKGKENITGYSYEPWHIRYVGIEVSTYIYNNNITLEEYLEI